MLRIASYSENYWRACISIAQQLQAGRSLNIGAINRIVRAVSSSYGLSSLPKNEHIIKHLTSHHYRRLLTVRPSKTASGVAIVAVLPKPSECPHGRCIYCPGGIESNTPLSYTGSEPSTKIAQRLNYDAYEQITSKIRHLQSRGHNTSKIEIVIVGGTFPSMPEEYQREFAKSCFDAVNGFRSQTLQAAIKTNETAERRCVGFTVETKPDYCKKPHIDLMLELGITRVEIGVQTLRDESYRAVNRGHTLKDVIESFKIVRDAGYKIVAHMMPGLPSSSPQKDIEDFKRLFEDDDFKPDMLKIYPTLVLRHTGLYKLFRDGRYSAYPEEDLINVLVEVKKIVPSWVRIMRVQREIESKDIVAGPRKGNLRQIVLDRLRDKGIRCKCIRCREAGLQRLCLEEDQIVLKRTNYTASGGEEVFLSYETIDGNTILGFLRLRRLANSHRPELEDAAVVRELHVYGHVVDVGQKVEDNEIVEKAGKGFCYYQHRGYGINLMKKAESIARNEFGASKLSVISGVGARMYYRKLGYNQDGPYVSKTLR